MNICRESTSEVELAVEQSISIHSAIRTNLQIATNKQPCRVNVDREMALQTSCKGLVMNVLLSGDEAVGVAAYDCGVDVRELRNILQRHLHRA